MGFILPPEPSAPEARGLFKEPNDWGWGGRDRILLKEMVKDESGTVFFGGGVGRVGAALRGLRDLGWQTRDPTCAPCSGSMEP